MKIKPGQIWYDRNNEGLYKIISTIRDTGKYECEVLAHAWAPKGSINNWTEKHILPDDCLGFKDDITLLERIIYGIE